MENQQSSTLMTIEQLEERLEMAGLGFIGMLSGTSCITTTPTLPS